MGRIWKVLIAVVLAAPIIYRLAFWSSIPKQPGKTVVRYMAWGYPSQLNTERELIRAFQAQPENADIDVEFIMAPMRSYYDKLQLMFVSGTAADVVRVNPDHFYAYVDMGFFKDLEPFIASDPEYRLDDFFAPARDAALVNGHHYGLGVLFTTTLIYYNKTLFKQAGMKDPWERFVDGEWTWDSFLDAARKLTVYDDRGHPVQFGTGSNSSIYSAAGMIWAMGSDLLTPDKKRSTVNSPEAVKAIQWMLDLSDKWHVAPTPTQGAMSVFTFESGKIAMMTDSSGESPTLRDAITKFEWDIAPVPAAANAVSAGYSAHILVMNSATKVPEAAWRYMRFMKSPTAERMLGCKLRRCIPTRRAVATSEEYLFADKPPFNMRAFIARVDSPQPQVPYSGKWSEWSTVWQSYLDAAFLGTKSVQQAMDEAAGEIDKILAGETD